MAMEPAHAWVLLLAISNGGANLMALVLEGYTLKNGILQREKMPELVGARS